MATELALWKATYDDAQTLTAPPRFADVQAKYLDALATLSSAGDDIANGIDQDDPSLIASATDKISQVAADFNDLTQMVKDLEQQAGV